MKKVILKIGGMSCSACQNRVEKYLNKQDGVKASVNLVLGEALIEYDEKLLTINDLERFIKESGYTSLGLYNEKEENKKDYSIYYLIVFGLLTIVLMYISMGHMLHLPQIPLLNMKVHPINYSIALFLITIPYIIYGFSIIKSGIKNIVHKSPNMDSLVTIGVLSCIIYSFINLILIINGNFSLTEFLYFESACTVIYFIKLGRFIDGKSKEKTKEAIKELVQITPKTALLKTKDGEKEVTIDEVKVGDTLICKPGMKVAVDGVITYGETHLDTAFITGESKQDKKKVNDKVIAGSINISGYIEYEAQKIGPSSTISEIVRLVVEATNTKAPIEKVADKVSGVFVPLIILISLITLIGYLLLGHQLNEAILSFVTVLVVACPCALGLATPLAVVISEGFSAKKGILIKTSETLESVHKVDTIIFDKTGTLTYGNLRISKINNYSNYKEEELIKMVASLEQNSSHPIASAFKTYTNTNKIKLEKITDFTNMPGIGVKGIYKGKTIYATNNKILKKLKIENKYNSDEVNLSKDGSSIIYVIENNQILATIGVKDIIRTNAKETISALQKMGKRVMMLSGDNHFSASIVAKELKINEVKSDLLPQDKEKILKELKNEGHIVMMVGDGINDAPSLAISDIGVSLNGKTDIAADSADVILMNDDISKIIDLLNISKRTIKIIKENLFWAFFYNILMIPIAIGLLKPFNISISPMVASISMMISSLTVVFNSLRLRR